MSITVITADIVHLEVDAIVNAASPALLGGGGVDGAIHRAAGPHLLAACRTLPEVSPGVRCPTGEARLTPGFDMAARWVIHTVGPIWRGGGHGEAGLLAHCYRASVALAAAHRLRSIAFPAISCGVYGYPAEHAAQVAVAALREALQHHADLHVQLCGFDARMSAILRHALDTHGYG